LIEDLNLLCVADRENQRIQCFTAGLSPKGAHQRAVQPTGTFVTKAQNIGRIMAIREKRKLYGRQVLFCSCSNYSSTLDDGILFRTLLGWRH
jgi:hypothetical protein